MMTVRWKEEYGGRITKQCRKLGDSCDWERERFTMDEGCNRAVRTLFVQLIQKRRSHNISMLSIRCGTLKTKFTRIVTHISNLNVKVLRKSRIKIIKVVFSHLSPVCVNLYSIVSVFIRANKRGRSNKIRAHVFSPLLNHKFYYILLHYKPKTPWSQEVKGKIIWKYFLENWKN